MDKPKVFNVDELIAIDTHVHLHGETGENESDQAARKYFRSTDVPRRPEEIAEYYRSRKIGCVVVNPARGLEAVREARRLIASGIRGFKLHPPVQQFHANDRTVYPFYEVINGARLPVIFHTGHSGIGTGMRGGGGVRLKYGNPMDIDDVAVDFPDMPIILAHPSFPWQDEAISICLHKPQVFIDLSGWSPKYFPPNLIQYANTLLRDKMLFGSDFPFVTPDRWLADFAKIPIRDEVRPLILKENAIRLLTNKTIT